MTQCHPLAGLNNRKVFLAVLVAGVQDQVLESTAVRSAELVSSETCLPALQVTVLALQSARARPSVSYQDTSYIGTGLTPTTSFSLSPLCKNSLSNDGRILGCWEGTSP